MKALAALVLAGCGAAAGAREEPRRETFPVSGTPIRIPMVYVPGRPGLPPFWIAEREVVWRDFNRFCEFPGEGKIDGVTRPSAGKPYLGLSGMPPEFQDVSRAVSGLRWHSAAAYAEWLSRKSGAVYRLPTEKEWEAALGAPPGDGWHRDTSGDQVHPPGEKAPNELGLVDMRGNVWEYALEPDAPPAFEPVLLGGAWNSAPAARMTPPAEWSHADPSRPFSTWWYRADFSQGFRLVRVPSTEGWEAAAASIRIAKLEGREATSKVGKSVILFARVTGEVRNGGDRALDELALKVYFLDPKGKPHLQDAAGGSTHPATYALCFPALASSAHPGEQARPLRPGESRAFSVDVPMSYDGAEEVDVTAFGASVLYLRFAP